MKKFLTTGLVLFLATASFAQVRVTGRIVDAAGAPVPGATVMVEGTTIGTTADADGSYTISAPSRESVLNFSFVGYESASRAVGNRTTINITLGDAALQVEEVVAIGYGTRRVRDLTGAVGSVTSESISERGASSVMEALQGQIPGVNISQNSAVAGGGFSIQIRGQQTMGDANAQQPLFVVDGIVVPDINFLNPGDIERVDILKDASSAAIYGSRGSNGVVLITTNQASSARERFSISYDGYYGIREVVRTNDFMNGDEWMQFRLYAYPTRTRNADNSATFAITHQNMTMAMGGSRMVAKRWAEKDYYDVIGGAFPNTATQNHFLNLSGMTGTTSYMMSMGYTKEEGSYQGNDFERVNLRGGFQTRLRDVVTIGFQTNMAFTNNDRGSDNIVRDVMRLNPFTPPYDEQGNLIPFPMNNTSSQIANAEFPIVTGTAFSSLYNPLIDAQNVVYNTRSYNVMANLFAELSPIKGLKLKTQFSPQLRTNRRGQFYDVLSDWSRTHANQTRALVNRSMDWEYTWDNSAYYEWESADGNHNFDVTGVYSVYLEREEETDIEGWDLSAPSYHGIYTAKAIQPLESDYGQTTMLSVIGRVNYAYKGKYLLTASYRTDGSSRLGAGNKWGAFPSVAAAWRISEEPFLKDWEPLYNAKIRASYGLTGNNRVSEYSTMTGLDEARWYGFGTTSATGQPKDDVGNVALGWEKSRELDLGLDVAFFNGRLSATFDWYDRLSSDLLMGMKVPQELGMADNSITSNVGSVRNRGIELGVTGVIVTNKDWRWSAGMSFSRNRNKIVELYGAKDDIIAERRFIGQPINVAYTYIYDGIVTAERAVSDPLAIKHSLTEGMGIVKDLDGNGILNADDRTITGNAFSDWTGSLTTSVSWKNLDFSMNIYADIGRYGVNEQLRSDAADFGDRGRIKLKLDYYVPEQIDHPDASAMVDDWYNAMIRQGYKLPANPMDALKPNTDARWGSYNGGGTYAPRPSAGDWRDHQLFYQDLSYVKVKNLTLGYTLPKAWTDKISLRSLRVYMNVLNPWCFTDKDFIGFDPEWAGSGFTGRGNLGGPATRVWQFGVNVKF